MVKTKKCFDSDSIAQFLYKQYNKTCVMKNILYGLAVLSFLICSCGIQNKTASIASDAVEEEAPVRIANDSLEYEVTIIDPGFTAYLASVALPESFYSLDFLESRNQVYVTNWNIRAQNPMQYDYNIYENIIDYQPNIDYGLEVNYKLFWYFQFAQRKYGMRLSGFRIYGPGGGVLPYRQRNARINN